MAPTTGSNQGEGSLRFSGGPKLTQTYSTLVLGILLITIISQRLKTPRYETSLILWTVNTGLFGLVSEQVYAYWMIGM